MGVKIIGLGSYLPEKVLTNFELSGMVDTSDEWITTRTGIKERRISCGESTWELAIKSSQRALENANVAPEDIDVIICSSSTPDFLFPSMGCIVQSKIGAQKAFAFDISAACSGFVYALDIARNYIEIGKAKNVLVVSSECLSKVVDYDDRGTCVLFGDGSGAAVVSQVNENNGIVDILLKCDGSGADALLCRAVKKTTVFSKLLNKVTSLGSKDKDQDRFTLSMDGQEVFKYAVRIIPSLITEILDKNNISIDQVKYIVPHQANIRIIQSAVKKLGIGIEKMAITIDKYGNTSSASVPICLDELVKANKVQRGDYIVLVAFGAGFTAGAALLKW